VHQQPAHASRCLKGSLSRQPANAMSGMDREQRSADLPEVGTGLVGIGTVGAMSTPLVGEHRQPPMVS